MRSVCSLYVYVPLNFARQRLGKHVTATIITHATIEELLDALFLCGPCRITYSILLKLLVQHINNLNQYT
jgi:hypothetical protein